MSLSDQEKIAVAKDYFRLADAGDPRLMDLFHEDATFSTGRMSGTSWAGGVTPGGRFCNVFEFRDGRIARLHVYLVPDYVGEDEPRFRWGRTGREW